MGASIDRLFQAVADELLASIDGLIDDYFRRAAEEEPGWSRRTELTETFRTMTRASMLEELELLRDGGPLPHECPPADAEFARMAASFGAGPEVLSDAYRRGHACQWDGWFALVEDQGCDPGTRRLLLGRASEFFFGYAARLSRLTLDEYMRERDRRMRDVEHRRVHLVGQLLGGEDVPPESLDYPVEGSHLALIAWGAAREDAVHLAAEATGRPLLLVAAAATDVSWAWLGGGALGASDLRGLARMDLPADARLAFGDEGHGRDGFRESHQQAIRAQRAGQRTGDDLTWYRDIALEALGAEDPEQARAFVRRELRGLEGEDARSRRLRETLEAWFAAGQNAAAAAAALGVHEQTVAARLHVVEQRTGAPAASRRAELELALRLRTYLG